MKPKLGQVYRNDATKRVFVVRREDTLKRIAAGGYTKVAEKAHERNDYSYLCGRDYCCCVG